MTSTGAGDDAMEVEAVGDTADRRGDDAEAGARMDSNNVGEEGGVPWVTVRCEPLQSHGNIVAAPGNVPQHQVSTNAAAAEAVGDTVDRRGDDADAGAHMDCNDDGEEGGVLRLAHASPSSESMTGSGTASLWITVPWAAGSADLGPAPTNASQLTRDRLPTGSAVEKPEQYWCPSSQQNRTQTSPTKDERRKRNRRLQRELATLSKK